MISNINFSNQTSVLTIIFSAIFILSFQACSSPSVNNPYAEKREARVDIFDFNSCVQAGNTVTRSFPPQCITKDGRVFMNYVKSGNRNTVDSEIIKRDELGNCKDKCGDGICQEIVCMALGCPCPENKETCPEDCS